MAIRHEDLRAAPEGVVIPFPVGPTRRRAARARMLARRRRTFLATALLLLVVLMVFAGGATGVAPASAPGAPARVTLAEGQTLWDLAERYAPPGVDLRAYVDALAELNDLGPMPAAGQRIRLPK